MLGKEHRRINLSIGGLLDTQEISFVDEAGGFAARGEADQRSASTPGLDFGLVAVKLRIEH